jgi:hypothetical protein
VLAHTEYSTSRGPRRNEATLTLSLGNIHCTGRRLSDPNTQIGVCGEILRRSGICIEEIYFALAGEFAWFSCKALRSLASTSLAVSSCSTARALLTSSIAEESPHLRRT